MDHQSWNMFKDIQYCLTDDELDKIISKMTFISSAVKSVFSTNEICPMNIEPARRDIHLEVVKFLLQIRYDLNIIVNSYGYSIIQVATFNRHIEVIYFLIYNGAIVDMTSKACELTALEIAKANGLTSVIKIFQDICYSPSKIT